jgi:acetyl-CoA C-acetyltransferase
VKRAEIVGVGVTPVGEHWERSLADLAREAVESALADTHGVSPHALFVGSALSGALAGQEHLGAYLADRLGLSVEVHRVEADGASGASALRLASLAVESGALPSALVLGIEKSTDVLPDRLERARSATLDADLDAWAGLTPAAGAALLLARYLHEYPANRGALGAFPLLAHENALTASHAYMKRRLSAPAYERAPAVASPLSLLDCAPDADGAAAVVVAASRGTRGVRIAGESVVTGPLSLAARAEPARLDGAGRGVAEALSRAGRSRDEVSLFELDDSFSILAALSLEAAGFSDRGLAPRDAQAGRFALSGSLPICTFGGNKARGNPLGAAGLYRVAEAVWQLRGQAGQNQVRGATVALVQSLGGLGATVITQVLE